MVHLQRKISSLGSLINQLQQIVRCSSSLKIKDSLNVKNPVPRVTPKRDSFKYADLSVRLANPLELRPKPTVDQLSFGKFFTDHMLKVNFYEALGGWQAPEIVPFENIVLHPAAKVLHYSVELFEGMKAYRGVDGKIRLFRPELNMERMNNSAVRAGLPAFRGDELIQCMSRLISIDQEWVPHSSASSLYIRPTYIGIETSEQQVGISLLADPKYTRAWPGGCGHAKLGSNYGPTIQVHQEALEKGLQQVLWLYGEDNQLTEIGTMNIFMVYINDKGKKEMVTPALNGLILPGVVRNSLLTMAKEWNQFEVSERVITMKEVTQLLAEGRLLEIFGCGTACVVSPVSYIDFMDQPLHIPTMEQPEPVYKMLLKHLLDIQYGVIPEHPWSLIVA